MFEKSITLVPCKWTLYSHCLPIKWRYACKKYKLSVLVRYTAVGWGAAWFHSVWTTCKMLSTAVQTAAVLWAATRDYEPSTSSSLLQCSRFVWVSISLPLFIIQVAGCRFRVVRSTKLFTRCLNLSLRFRQRHHNDEGTDSFRGRRSDRKYFFSNKHLVRLRQCWTTWLYMYVVRSPVNLLP